MLTWLQKLTPKNRLEKPLLRRSRFLLPAAVVVAIASAGFGQPASATVFEILVNANFGTVDASGTALYTIDDEDTVGSVMLIFDATGLSSSLEKITGWYVNYEDAGMATVGSLVFAFDSGFSTGPEADSLDQGPLDSFQADGDGNYDILFSWLKAASGPLFQAGEIVKYDVTGAEITAADFFHASVMVGGEGTFCTAMRIQGTGDGNGSDWVGGNCIPETMEMPEPGTLALFSIGLLGLGALARRRRRVA